jgi:hypothetical protein
MYFLREKKINYVGIDHIWPNLVKKSLTKNNLRWNFFVNIKKTTYWIDLDQPGLTCQVHVLDHETVITL